MKNWFPLELSVKIVAHAILLLYGQNCKEEEEEEDIDSSSNDSVGMKNII